MADLFNILSKPNQTLFDVAVQQYGTVQAVIDLEGDNDLLYTTDFTLATGTELKIKTAGTSIKEEASTAEADAAAEQYAITVRPYQTLFDVAVQEYGGVEGIMDLFSDNPDLLYTTDFTLPQGTLLNIKTAGSERTKSDVQKYYRQRGLKVCTGDLVLSELEGGDFIITEDGEVITSEDGDGLLVET